MQQWWSRAATFINTFVNPIGLDNIGWKYYIWYCCWITVEGVVIYLFFPETAGRTLEELSFCKTSPTRSSNISFTNSRYSVRGRRSQGRGRCEGGEASRRSRASRGCAQGFTGLSGSLSSVFVLQSCIISFFFLKMSSYV